MLFPDSFGNRGGREPVARRSTELRLSHSDRTAEENRLLIHHVAYREEHYSCPATCIRGIRELLAQDWRLVELRGGTLGPFLALWRKDDGT